MGRPRKIQPPAQCSGEGSIFDDLDEGEDSWVIVRRQKVTVLIPPPDDDAQKTRVLATHEPESGNGNETRTRTFSMDDQQENVTALPPSSDAPTATIIMPGVSRKSKTITKRPRMLPGLRSLLDGRLLLNQTLRATLIERKLEKAGGLSNWLGSIGLGQFVRIFSSRSVGKFQLVNLTMNKLKDMGVDAVGPRRKLMHAIDCICQPYCFELK